MNYYVVTEEELENLRRAEYLLGAKDTEQRTLTPSTKARAALAACRARPVPDWATHLCRLEPTEDMGWDLIQLEWLPERVKR